jgi:predicted  nucleic acid-binding Zn-ribbon protein
LRALSAELSHALEGQTRTASLESELSQLRALYDEEVKKTNALQVCVMEQYRHLKSMEEAGGELHPDIGLATLSSLLGATVLTKPEESTALEANLAALAEELATVKTAAKAKDEALEALEARCTELQETLDATKEKELNASLAARAATAKVNELSDLLKLNSQRMQAELQRTSSDCMNAMKARDALQVRVYENLTQLQIAEARVRDLERATTTAQPLVQFARDVQALVLGLDASKSVDAEGSLPVQLAATSPSGKKKKGKK